MSIVCKLCHILVEYIHINTDQIYIQAVQNWKKTDILAFCDKYCNVKKYRFFSPFNLKSFSWKK